MCHEPYVFVMLKTVSHPNPRFGIECSMVCVEVKGVGGYVTLFEVVWDGWSPVSLDGVAFPL